MKQGSRMTSLHKLSRTEGYFLLGEAGSHFQESYLILRND